MKRWTKAELIQYIEELTKVAQENKDLAERAVKQVEERDRIETEEITDQSASWH